MSFFDGSSEHEEDYKNAALEIIGYIGGVPIPDVTIEGRSPMLAARHVADEAKEVEEAVDAYERAEAQGFSQSEIIMIAALYEVIDENIISMSCLNLFRHMLGEEYVDDAVRAVLRKNSRRRYYDIENPIHVGDGSSGSTARVYNLEERKRKNGGDNEAEDGQEA